MADRVPPIARIRLARSIPRLLVGPAILLIAGLSALGVAWLSQGTAAVALAIAGGVVVVLGLALAVLPLSLRLDVEEAGIHLRWLGGARIYVLARGPVTRVVLRGRNASSLQPSLGALGWAVGPAWLRGDEPIEVVRLAPTRTAILVPTERGRLAVAAASEEELLAALASAARSRQRLEELARSAPPIEPPAAAPAPAGGPPALTGIERALLEERLAAERTAALAAAQAERGPAAVSAPAGAATSARPVEGPVAQLEPSSSTPVADTRRALRLPRPGWLRRPRIARPGTRAAAIVLPTAVAGLLYGLAVAVGRVPDVATDRPVMLALVLGGPAATIGMLMAVVWWPRLLGVMLVAAVSALVVVGRALLLG